MNTDQGAVLWFTGLSGSGKTTTATLVRDRLLEYGCRVELLDGDELRRTISKGLDFSDEGRRENIRRMVYVAGLLAKHGVHVLVSAISPHRDMRDYARSELPGFLEVYVKCPLAECEKRDVKGLYARARNGEIQAFTGISSPYEEPLHADITIDTSVNSLEDNCLTILARLGLPVEAVK